MESLNFVQAPAQRSQNESLQWGKDTHFTNTPHSTSPTRQTGPLPRILSPTTGQVLKAWSGSWDGEFSSDDDEPEDPGSPVNDEVNNIFTEKNITTSNSYYNGNNHNTVGCQKYLSDNDTLMHTESPCSELSKKSSFKYSFKVEKKEDGDLKTSLSKYSSWGSGFGSFRSQVYNFDFTCIHIDFTRH